MSISTLASAIAVMAALSCSEIKPEPPVVENPTQTRTMTVQENVEVENAAGQFSIEVEANFEYCANPQVKWISFDRIEGNKVWFNIEENTQVAERVGTVKFADIKDSYFNKTATVTQKGDPAARFTLSLADKNATAETKALYANLWKIAEDGFMFGHHDDLWYGRYWYNEPGMSDTKSVCGDYPAVFSVDFGAIMDNRYQSEENAIRRRVIIEAYDKKRRCEEHPYRRQCHKDQVSPVA